MYEVHQTLFLTLLLLTLSVGSANGAEIHVAVKGHDDADGKKITPVRTISRAGQIAQPGDVITVHEGVYRERVNPPRGGTSDDKRIVYQAAPGEKVIIKGSERVTGWKKVEEHTWSVTLPNSFFGNFNPYSDLIKGDWYEARQPYHTGAVYVNGTWLKEAARKSDVVKTDLTYAQDMDELQLMNVASLQPEGTEVVLAAQFSSKKGEAKVLELPEGKSCVGRLENGNWLTYDNVDCGNGTEFLTLSLASPVGGGFLEIRQGSPEGAVLGVCRPTVTAEWTHFQSFRTPITKVAGKQKLVLVCRAEPRAPTNSTNEPGLWFAKVDKDTTTLWAQFKGVDPNEALVEINVRKTVFYPDKPGRNYITVRGFTLEQAATPWSPPTAEQVGVIGTHWSKGWLIESNTVRFSTCAGVTLGKHGDEFDNTFNYNRTIRIGLEKGWKRDTIGSHVVRGNHIYNCDQGGIIGSLGCSFSLITGNEIHDITQHHPYGGCETAGIKLHGAVDTVISRNHIYRCGHWGGLWLDWMAQGARVNGNLLHDNSNDFMFEMNHGPMLIDNNILLSNRGILDASGGSAYAHNLINGTQDIWADLTARKTPVFRPHSTDIVSTKLASSNFGALGGHKARFTDPVENTEQYPVYQTIRYGSEGYRLDVPKGLYCVTLKFNEPFYNKPGQRRFGITLQGRTLTNGLDLIAVAGKNRALDLVEEKVRVEDGVLRIGFIREREFPSIAGIEVVGTQEREPSKPFALRINCGGDAWKDFVADFEVVTAESRSALMDQWGGVGVGVDQHDDRFFNNLFSHPKKLSVYNEHSLAITAAGNVFLAGAKPSTQDKDAVVAESFDPDIKLVEKNDGWWLEMKVDSSWQEKVKRTLVTSPLLGKATRSEAPFEQPDGTPYRLDTDYFGEKRRVEAPSPGPFNIGNVKVLLVKVCSKLPEQ
jgi:alpha-L-arabinofuranosidase